MVTDSHTSFNNESINSPVTLAFSICSNCTGASVRSRVVQGSHELTKTGFHYAYDHSKEYK